MFPFDVFGLVVVAAIVALMFLYLFSRAPTTRAVALQNVRDLREHLCDRPGSPECNGDMVRLYELVVNAALSPATRSPRERTDVDLDLHLVRKPDAEALVKLLLRSARFTGLKPVTGASDALSCIAKKLI